MRFAIFAKEYVSENFHLSTESVSYLMACFSLLLVLPLMLATANASHAAVNLIDLAYNSTLASDLWLQYLLSIRVPLTFSTL